MNTFFFSKKTNEFDIIKNFILFIKKYNIFDDLDNFKEKSKTR